MREIFAWSALISQSITKTLIGWHQKRPKNMVWINFCFLSAFGWHRSVSVKNAQKTYFLEIKQKGPSESKNSILELATPDNYGSFVLDMSCEWGRMVLYRYFWRAARVNVEVGFSQPSSDRSSQVRDDDLEARNCPFLAPRESNWRSSPCLRLQETQRSPTANWEHG